MLKLRKKSFIHPKCNLYEYENIVNINIRQQYLTSSLAYKRVLSILLATKIMKIARLTFVSWLPKVSEYVKVFDYAKIISFLVEDKELTKYNETWNETKKVIVKTIRSN